MTRRAALALAAPLAALLLTALPGCRPAADAPPEPSEAPVEEVEPTVVSLYFPDADLEHLEAEARDVPSLGEDEKMVVEHAVAQLLEGPTEEGHTRVIPEGTRLLDTSIDAGLATINLSKEFVDGFEGGTNVAHLAVYSLVNTVAEVPGVERVQVLVEGDPVDDFAGAVSLASPLEPDPTLTGGDEL